MLEIAVGSAAKGAGDVMSHLPLSLNLTDRFSPCWRLISICFTLSGGIATICGGARPWRALPSLAFSSLFDHQSAPSPEAASRAAAINMRAGFIAC